MGDRTDLHLRGERHEGLSESTEEVLLYHLDDITVWSEPYPNLTFQVRTPPVVVSPSIGERYSSSVIPGRTNYVNFWAANNSTAALPVGAQFAVVLKNAAGAELARMDPLA